MKNLKKEYAYRDVIMLVTAKAVACNFKDNIEILSKFNVKWNEAYANELIARIEEAHNSQLGYDLKKELREATSNLRKITAEVLTALGIFKNLVTKFYRGETEKKNEIFTALGFKNYSRKSVVRTQTGLINLLYSFKANLSDPMRSELIGKGIPQNILESITTNAAVFENANNIQEVLKSNTSAKIDSRITLYNSIFLEVIGICVIVRGHFNSSASKKAMFNFKKIAGVTAKKQKQEAQAKLAESQQSQEGAENSEA